VLHPLHPRLHFACFSLYPSSSLLSSPLKSYLPSSLVCSLLQSWSPSLPSLHMSTEPSICCLHLFHYFPKSLLLTAAFFSLPQTIQLTVTDIQDFVPWIPSRVTPFVPFTTPIFLLSTVISTFTESTGPVGSAARSSLAATTGTTAFALTWWRRIKGEKEKLVKIFFEYFLFSRRWFYFISHPEY
jgi:hypothetical protein